RGGAGDVGRERVADEEGLLGSGGDRLQRALEDRRVRLSPAHLRREHRHVEPLRDAHLLEVAVEQVRRVERVRDETDPEAPVSQAGVGPGPEQLRLPPPAHERVAPVEEHCPKHRAVYATRPWLAGSSGRRWPSRPPRSRSTTSPIPATWPCSCCRRLRSSRSRGSSGRRPSTPPSTPVPASAASSTPASGTRPS